uniref:Uncharacterized protein n=1 Tax=Triticum urartu TaxID=4572 RepID=A0A8R7PLB3_TRIUA
MLFFQPRETRGKRPLLVEAPASPYHESGPAGEGYAI